MIRIHRLTIRIHRLKITSLYNIQPYSEVMIIIFIK